MPPRKSKVNGEAARALKLVSVRLFGPPGLVLDDGRTIPLDGRRPHQLIIIAAESDNLLGSDAVKRLREEGTVYSLASLRKTLNDARTYLKGLDLGVTFARRSSSGTSPIVLPVSSDVTTFRRAFEVRDFEEALRVYAGHFLSGYENEIDRDAAAAFGVWVLETRRLLQRDLVQALDKLARISLGSLGTESAPDARALLVSRFEILEPPNETSEGEQFGEQVIGLATSLLVLIQLDTRPIAAHESGQPGDLRQRIVKKTKALLQGGRLLKEVSIPAVIETVLIAGETGDHLELRRLAKLPAPPKAGPMQTAAAQPAPALLHFRRIDSTFLGAARRQAVASILTTGVGDWPLIAQGLVVQRDLLPELVAALESRPTRLRLLVIAGVPGSGKTTLLRHLGRVLVDHGVPVYELPGGEPDARNWWPEFARIAVTEPAPVVLLNDVFVNDGIVELLKDHTLGLTATILATSPVNELKRVRPHSGLELLHATDRPSRGSNPWPTLDSPTDRELRELHGRPEFQHIDDKEWQRLTTRRDASGNRVKLTFLAVMLQLTGGAEYETIVDDFVHKLGPGSWRHKLYGMIATLGSLGLHVPTTILEDVMTSTPLPGYYAFREQLLIDVGTTDVPGPLTGLVMREEYPVGVEAWTTGHRSVAQRAIEGSYATLTHTILLDTFRFANASRPESVAFTAAILGKLSRGPVDRFEAVLENSADDIERLALAAPDTAILFASALSKRTGRLGDRYQRLLDELISVGRPSSAGQAHFLIAEVRRREGLGRAIELAQGWLDDHPDDVFTRGMYESDLRKAGRHLQLATYLRDTERWLRAPQQRDERLVRSAFLRSLATIGTHYGQPPRSRWAMSRQSLAEAEEWLAAHPGDKLVRTAHMRLMQVSGRTTDVFSALSDTAQWLRDRSGTGVVGVWVAALGLLESSSIREHSITVSSEQASSIESFLHEAGEWLERAEYQADAYIRLLGIVRQVGTYDRKLQLAQTAYRRLVTAKEPTTWGELSATLALATALARLDGPSADLRKHYVDLCDAGIERDAFEPQYRGAILAYTARLLEPENSDGDVVTRYEAALLERNFSPATARFHFARYLLGKPEADLSRAETLLIQNRPSAVRGWSPSKVLWGSARLHAELLARLAEESSYERLLTGAVTLANRALTLAPGDSERAFSYTQIGYLCLKQYLSGRDSRGLERAEQAFSGALEYGPAVMPARDGLAEVRRLA